MLKSMQDIQSVIEDMKIDIRNDRYIKINRLLMDLYSKIDIKKEYDDIDFNNIRYIKYYENTIENKIRIDGKIDFIIKNNVKDAFIYLSNNKQEKYIKKLLDFYNTNGNKNFKLIDFKTDLYKFNFIPRNETHEIINDYDNSKSLKINLNYQHNQLISIQEVSKEQFFNYLENREKPFNDSYSDSEDEDS